MTRRLTHIYRIRNVGNRQCAGRQDVYWHSLAGSGIDYQENSKKKHSKVSNEVPKDSEFWNGPNMTEALPHNR